MKLTGIEVPVETVSHMAPNMVLKSNSRIWSMALVTVAAFGITLALSKVVIADDQGTASVVKVDPSSMTEGEAFLEVTADQDGMCYKLINGQWVWVPC